MRRREYGAGDVGRDDVYDRVYVVDEDRKVREAREEVLVGARCAGLYAAMAAMRRALAAAEARIGELEGDLYTSREVSISTRWRP